MSEDISFYAGYGFAFDEVDTSDFTKLEKHLYDTLFDPDTDWLEDTVFDYNDEHVDDPVFTDGYVDGQEEGGDTFFTYIPVRSVVSDDPVKSYTYAEAGELINKHTRGLLKAIYDYAKDDDEFPTDLKKMTDKEIDSLVDSLVKKIDPSGLSSYQEYVQVF